MWKRAMKEGFTTMNARTVLIAALTSIALSGVTPGWAQAGSLVVGWDFSQYAGDGDLSVDATFDPVSTLPANYSSLDPNGAGAESGALGTLYYNGQFGSTAVSDLFSFQLTPTAGSLASNLSGNAANPVVPPFNSFTTLTAEGQFNTSDVRMTTDGLVDLVFQADLSSVPEMGANWLLSFGGQTFEGQSSLSVAFSLDGTSYGAGVDVLLNTLDTRFEVPLGAGLADAIWVRMSLNADGGQPTIDNLAIHADLSVVPEPAAASLLLLGLGLVGLAAVRRRHAA
jgi:hypothetical protein